MLRAEYGLMVSKTHTLFIQTSISDKKNMSLIGGAVIARHI
jgi:hypothetical protein